MSPTNRPVIDRPLSALITCLSPKLERVSVFHTRDACALLSRRVLKEALTLTLLAAVIAFTVHFLFDKKERSKALQSYASFDLRYPQPYLCESKMLVVESLVL